MKKISHLEDHLGYWLRFVSNQVSLSFRQRLEREEIAVVEWYSLILQKCETPKILFHATPGCNTPLQVLEWAKNHMHNLKTVDIGAGYHYLPEDNPILIGQELFQWYKTLWRSIKLKKHY